jgi:hypothetical protein
MRARASAIASNVSVSFGVRDICLWNAATSDRGMPANATEVERFIQIEPA